MIMMMMMAMTMMTNIIPYRRTKTHIWEKVLMGIWVHPMMIMAIMMKMMMFMTVVVGCTQIPISTLSHIWVFVRLYGIVFVIIAIIIIIIIIIIKSEGVNAQL